MIRWVLMDCDGVLADSEPISARCLAAQLSDCGLRITADDVRRNLIGRQRAVVERALRRHHDFVLSSRFWDDFVARREVCFQASIAPVPGASELLKELRAGGWRIAVATDAARDKTQRNLTRIGLSGLVDGPILSPEILGSSKRHSVYFLRAVEWLRTNPAAMAHVDDRRFAISSARRAGLSTIGYVGPGSSSTADAFAPIGGSIAFALREVLKHLVEASRG